MTELQFWVLKLKSMSLSTASHHLTSFRGQQRWELREAPANTAGHIFHCRYITLCQSLASLKPSIHPCRPCWPIEQPSRKQTDPLDRGSDSQGRLIWVVKETLVPEEDMGKMTGLNSLTNFYCPQISSPVSHDINLSPHQINDCLFKNERVDEVKSALCLFFMPLPLLSLGSISGIFHPGLRLTLPNSKSLLPTPLIDGWAKEQRAIKG